MEMGGRGWVGPEHEIYSVLFSFSSQAPPSVTQEEVNERVQEEVVETVQQVLVEDLTSANPYSDITDLQETDTKFPATLDEQFEQ
jgi:hypothetical protein